ncbi:permease [Radiobacillus sp. PE A8.2]|uniref:permease n=1 Tax=Radiobacillus sp. PE A8.2 TaxID=3380349 RepID=UPI00388D6E87
MYNRIAYFIFGCLFLLMGAFLIVAAIMSEAAPPIISYIILSMAIMSFSLSYLYPQFIQKDERMRMIRQKGMFFAFIAFVGYSIVLTTLLQFEVISLTGLEAIQILTCLLIVTVFVSFVILSRVY